MSPSGKVADGTRTSRVPVGSTVDAIQHCGSKCLETRSKHGDVEAMSELQSKPSCVHSCGCGCGVTVDKALVVFKELKKHMQITEKWGRGCSEAKSKYRPDALREHQVP